MGSIVNEEEYIKTVEDIYKATSWVYEHFDELEQIDQLSIVNEYLRYGSELKKIYEKYKGEQKCDNQGE